MNSIEIEYKNKKDVLLKHRHDIDLIYRLYFISQRSIYERMVIVEKKEKIIEHKDIFGFNLSPKVFVDDCIIDSKSLEAYNTSLNNNGFSIRVYQDDLKHSRRNFNRP